MATTASSGRGWSPRTESDDPEKDRREAYRAKDMISNLFWNEESYINGKRCFIAVRASPARREHFAKACTCTLMRVCGDANEAAVPSAESGDL